MTGRRTPLPALVVAALLLVPAACSSGTPDATAPASPPTPSSPAATPSATPTPTPAPTSASCPPAASTGLPDGAWAGPLTARVRGRNPQTQTKGTGSGQLQVLVENGTVTGGTWTLTWEAAGPSSAHESQATLTMRGQVAGTLTGTAEAPVVRGPWSITGKATVTLPVTATAPIDASGHQRTTLAVRARGCGLVGTFVATFRGHDPWAASVATARWVGQLTG